MNILWKSLAVGAGVAAIALGGTAASAATDMGSIDVTNDGAGNYSAGFGDDAVGSFDYVYTVNVPVSGLTDLTINISAGTFSSVTFNGAVVPISQPGATNAHLTIPSLQSGSYQLAIAGNGDNSGSFEGSISLVSSAVPEPASWAMMIGGVGFAGGMMRRRAKIENGKLRFA